MTSTSVGRIVREKRRIVVPLALVAIANVVLYAVVVFPLQRQVANAEVEANAQHMRLNAARADLKNAKATITGKAQADSALQKFYKDVLPASQGAARGLTYTRLAQLARQANVKLEHGSNGVSHAKGSSLSKLTTTYTLTGDYRDVRRFIYSLETAPEFIVLENVSLTSAGEQVQSRSLTMSLDIATYFWSGNVEQ
jgi:type IV pilus assembly protein PilO